MISSLSAWQWIKLITAFILFFSPGLVFINLSQSLKKILLPIRLVLAFGLSLGFWILLLIWLQLFNISINSWIIRILFSILFVILLTQLFMTRLKILDWLKDKKNHPELLLIGFGILIFILYLYFYRNLVAGMGSDSMHHTLISSLFIENGQIPEDYGPYAPVVTFSYHFGFHAYIAAMSLLSGITPRLMVVISGAILMGLASLAGGVLVYYLTRRTLPGIISEAVIGIIYVFPSYSLLWGRYTQLMGTIMLMIYLLALFFWDQEEDFSLKFSPLLILITIGLIFSHYRIAITAIIFTIVFLIVRKNLLSMLKKHITQWILMPLGALVLSSPWLIQLFIARQRGYEAAGVQTKVSFFSLDRLGPLFHSEPQTWILIGLSVVAVVIGIIKKDRIIAVTAIWGVVLAMVTQPGISGYTIDPVTMIISSYVPITILIGLGLSNLQILRSTNPNGLVANGIILLILLVGLVSGVSRWKAFEFPKHTYITPEDLEAASWIKRNTDPESLFMINTFQFQINEHLIIGLDGGYWLPVIAERQTVVPPMVSQIEKLNNPEAINAAMLFHKFQGELTGKDVFSKLLENGIDYVYIGTRGGIIKDNNLRDSKSFALVYDNNSVSIYKIVQ